MDFVVNYTAI